MRPIKHLTEKKTQKPTLKCPFCGQYGNQNIVDKAYIQQAGINHMAYRRRRECQYCKLRYSTYETLMFKTKLYVMKRDGRRQPFSRAKIGASIRKAFIKRPLTAERLDRIIDNIQRQVDTAHNIGEKREVLSAYLGQLVMTSLRELDEVAFIRYASVFHAFYSREHYAKLLEMLNMDAESASDGEPTETEGTGPTTTMLR